MNVNVRVFAHLRERLGFSERTLELPAGATVDDVWKQLTGEEAVPSHVLCAVNLEYTTPDRPLDDGEELAFFPPVTGG